MLDDLDRVPWADLTHAYGPATDVPALLRALADGTGSVDPLFGNVWHQGTVYPATAPVVPFLVELALARPEHAAALVALLGYIARGSGYHQVHHPFATRPDPSLPEHLQREREDVGRAHAAVGAAWPALAPLLGHPDPEVRRSAITCAGSLAGVGAEVAPDLLAARGEDPVSRARVLVALASLVHHTAARNAWRMDPTAWRAPLDDAGRSTIVGALRETADHGATPLERVLAADALLLLRVHSGRAVEALVADVLDATDALAAHFRDHVLFPEDPPLRLAVVAARCSAPAVPASVFYDLDELAASRSLRPRVVEVVVDLLRHADPGVRKHAGSQVRHLGRALAPHADAVVQAVAGDPVAEALATRPLRLLGHPAGDRFLDAVLRGGDPLLLLFLVDLVRPGDPQGWRSLLTVHLARATGKDSLPGDAWPFGRHHRSGSQSLTTTTDQLARRLRTALERLDGGPGEVRRPSPPRKDAPAPTQPGWPAVDVLQLAWEAGHDAAALLSGVVAQLVPQPSGRAALALVKALPLGAPELSWDPLRERVAALLASDHILSYASIEDDEAFLEDLRGVRDALR
jgi:hypothetical protein